MFVLSSKWSELDVDGDPRAGSVTNAEDPYVQSDSDICWLPI